MQFVISYLVIDKCKLPKINGNCEAYAKVWHFNYTTKKCEQFVYGGCGGNANNFPTSEKCYSECSGGKISINMFIKIKCDGKH